MGLNASMDIRRICNNEKIVERQLNFRSQIVHQGSKRSLHLPANLPWGNRAHSNESLRRTPQNRSQESLAVVVTCFNGGQSLDECLQSLEQQTRKPSTVVVVYVGSTREQTIKDLKKIQPKRWQIIHRSNGGPALAKNAGIEAVFDSGLHPLGFIFLSADVTLAPGFVAACESVLQQCPEVGLVSCWTQNVNNRKKIWIKPCPSFPTQWLSNNAVPFSAIRTEALHESGCFRPALSQGYEDWDLCNALMAKGWVAVTVPEILGYHRIGESLMPHNGDVYTYRYMRRALLERFPDLIARNVGEILLLNESNSAGSFHKETISLQKQITTVHMMLRYPRVTALLVLEKVKKKIFRHSPVRLLHEFME
jgi:GT2 family glycosyltransferase